MKNINFFNFITRMKYVFINIFIMKREKCENSNALNANLSSVGLKNCCLFPAMHVFDPCMKSTKQTYLTHCMCLCNLCFFFYPRNLLQTITLILLFKHTHVKQGRRMELMQLTFGFKINAHNIGGVRN